jgi:rod shape-determining protein MreB
LKYYIDKALPKFNIFKPEIMVSVPSGVTSTERRSVIEVTVKAGAKNAYVVKEPVLAAIGAGIPIHEARGRIIVDIGGGTTDVAVISLGGIVCANSIKCAGNKIDKAIIDYMKKVHNLIIGDQTAEEMKIQIGSALPLEEELSMNVKGRDSQSGLPTTIEIKTNEITKAIDKELKQIISAIKTVLQETPPELSRDIIDNGIIMSGGSSMLRHFPVLVERRTGVKAEVATDPIFCVSKGTGHALSHLDVYKKSILAKR